MAEEQKIGKVFSYYSKIGVAAINLESSLAVGDTIHIKGSTTDFTQTVDSMQIEHEKVKKATKGQSIGLRVKDKVRPSDDVYRVAKQ